MHDTSQTLPAELLMVQFLEWVAARPRCYADVKEAWRTSCPRLPVWEAAMDGDLVRIDHASARNGRLRGGADPAGRAALSEGSAHRKQ